MMASGDHQMLAALIKGVHENLRREYQIDGKQIDELWEKHCENKETLQEYAKAMHLLATTFWEQNNICTRITWCHNICRNYFRSGGIEKAVKKDLCRSFNRCECSELLGQKQYPEPFQRLHLLDVGSCYGPFNHFDDYLTVSIDLCPAVKEVLQCDFLKSRVSDCKTNNLEIFLQNLCNPVESLPSCGFHIVVFSLLLEYLPSFHQRWLCCKKAYDLLSPNGLLLIITPDSKHVNHNSVMMKCWKLALEHLGFRRLLYEKLPHLHCMAFRKSCTMEIHDYVCQKWKTVKVQLLNKISVKGKPNIASAQMSQPFTDIDNSTVQKVNHNKAENLNSSSVLNLKCPCALDIEFEYLLFIPQDFNEYKELPENQDDDIPRTVEEEENIRSCFEELPLF